MGPAGFPAKLLQRYGCISYPFMHVDDRLLDDALDLCSCGNRLCNNGMEEKRWCCYGATFRYPRTVSSMLYVRFRFHLPEKESSGRCDTCSVIPEKRR